MSSSVDEEVARDFICFGNPDATVIVVDATCLERNLNLVLQTLEITNNVVVCVNLMDEAKRKGIIYKLFRSYPQCWRSCNWYKCYYRQRVKGAYGFSL